MFVKYNDKDNFNWFIWVFISKGIVVFVIAPTRSASVPAKTLFDLDIDKTKIIDTPILESEARKILSVDKFSSYKMLERLGLVELAFCWAHQRREFINLKVKFPDLSIWADEWIERIANLYHINNQRITYEKDSSSFIYFDQKLKENISQFEQFFNNDFIHPAQIALINSIKQHWKGLSLFVNNPEIPMDNNLAERMLRLAVLGRKNYWGNNSIWALHLTATMYSIIQTCHLNNISPRAYLTYYFNECLKIGRKNLSSDKIKSLLPLNLTDDIKRKVKINQPEKVNDS